jgi:N-hydroxyarylamine O-acetyltransferase
MKADNFSLNAYFERVGYQGTPAADIGTVGELMKQQLFTVPFENLDVQAGKVVSLVPEEIVEKIVGRKRGGYCYEVNGLFAMALEALGIRYQFVAARPMFYPVRRPKTHMAIVAFVGGHSWLCDLGFGSYGIRAPVRLDTEKTEVRQDDDTFFLEKEGETGYLLKAMVEGVWANQYAFDLSPQEWIDFAPANYLNSTHPDAVFVQKPLVVLHNPSGRTILFGDSLKTIERGSVRKRIVAQHERDSVLATVFGLPGINELVLTRSSTGRS